MIQNEEIVLDAGTFYLLAPGMRHHWRNKGRQTAATIGLLIDAKSPGRWPAGSGVEDCCHKLVRRVKGKHRFDAAGDDELRHLFWLAADHLTALEPRETIGVVGALMALVGHCSNRLEGAVEQAAPPDDVAQQIRRLLLSRVNDRLSINDVPVSSESARRGPRPPFARHLTRASSPITTSSRSGKRSDCFAICR